MLLRFLLKNVRQPSLMCITSRYGKCTVIADVTEIKLNRFSNEPALRYSTRRSTGIDKAAENSSDGLSAGELRALQDDSDNFGTLSFVAETSKAPADTLVPNHNSILLQQHADKIDELIKAQDILGAFKVFADHVLERDRLHPPISMFLKLLDECIRYQLPENAFRVLSFMIERQLPVSLDTIDKVIESCELLEQSAKKMRLINRYLARNLQTPTASIQNRMIRCFIRSGQWRDGLISVDLMKADGFELENETIPFVLEGWCYDWKNGFRKVLDNWHEMMRNGHKVNVNTLNALLNCILKCDIGDLDELNETIHMIRSKYNESTKKETENPSNNEQNKQIDAPPKFLGDGRPNLLHSPPLKGYLVTFESVKDPQKRLLILGGLSEILKIIKSNEIIPTLKTVQLLLSVIPNTMHAENKVIALIRAHNLPLNIEFYQQVLTRMSIRQDYDGAKAVVEWMRDQNVEMDLVTYGLWAVSCKSLKHAEEFLDHMRNVPRLSRPGVEVLNAMLTNATRYNDNNYAIAVLRHMCEENIEPNGLTIKLIRDFKKSELAKLKKFRKPDKRTRNEFFKLSREYEQWARHFNIDRRTLIDTEESDEQSSGHEIRVKSRLSKKALELHQKHLKGSGRKQRDEKIKKSIRKY